MDEKKIYSLIVTLVCFVLMVLLVIGVAIYTWATGGFDAVDSGNEPAVVETANTTS